MKLLTTVKYSINFLFFSFILTGLLNHVLFYNGLPESTSTTYFWWLHIYIISAEVTVLLALYYLREFVLSSIRGTPLDESTRKCLKLSGIFCLVYGLLDCSTLLGIFDYYRANSEFNNHFVGTIFRTCSSLFFTFFIGIFFIYLSKILESSDEIRQENKLTI
ncbi:DUF2975 domain-containing protein [Neolewinella antarctica]|uniref:DUF2975 domain-containing protein n=1 Tax=Neolewinella antarctica TaxID=442734 RepID=A0ABX0XF40_9BACT|nr:hypothetical protein [Neolewinella antarctica]